MESAYPAVIFLAPMIAAVVLPFLRKPAPQLVQPLALGSMLISVWASLQTAALVIATDEPVRHTFGGWAPPYGIQFRVDHLSALMVVLITGLSAVVLLYSRKALDYHLESRCHIYYSLYLLFTVGLAGQCLTGDLFNLYVFLEVSALTGYALIAVGDKESPLAAFRYIILGTLAAASYLIGLAYLYGLTGSLNFEDVARILSQQEASRTLFVALTFMALGFAIKAALFPLHAWLPDAYSFSPNVTTAFMAAVGTKVAAYGIFRVLFTIYDVTSHPALATVLEAMGWLAAGGIIIGSLLAIAQTDLKRMLAYSSVSQIGYVILGFSLMNRAGITGAVLHIVNHAVMKCCLFLATGTIMAYTGRRDIRHFAGISSVMPMTAATFTVAALSMVGLPPLAGFFSKWYLVLGAVDASNWTFVGVILVSSLLNAIYFFRIIERLYLRDPTKGDEPHAQADRLPLSMKVPLIITAIAIVVLGLGSWPLVDELVAFVVPKGM